MPILVPPVDGVLCSPEEVMTQLNKTSSVDYGEILDYCKAVTAVIENLCGPILPATVTETHRVTSDVIVLNSDNVQAVTSVTRNDTAAGTALTVSSSPYLTSNAYWLDTNGILRLGYTTSGFFTVIYTAGMASVPDAINLAARLMVADLWKTQQGGAAAGLPPVFEDDTVTVGGEETPNGRRIYELLEPYRRAPSVA